MIDKLKIFFTENIAWKLVALVLAVLLWFIAVYIEDPVVSKTYPSSLEIKYIDVLEENNMVLLNEDTLKNSKVEFSISGKTRFHSTGLFKSSLKPYIDMREFVKNPPENIGEPVSAKIQYDPPDWQGYAEIKYTRPATVNVIIDRVETREFAVTPVIFSPPAKGYEAGDISLTPSTVQITGPSTFLDSIHAVRVNIGLEGTQTDYDASEKIIIYNSAEENITDKFKIDNQYTSVFVYVNKPGHIFVRKPEILGYAANGYAVSDVELSPQYIEVVGKAEDVAALKEITLDGVSIMGVSSDQTFQRDIKGFLANYNLEVKDGTPSTVTVTVRIEKEASRVITVDTANLTPVGDTEGIAYDTTLKAALKGKEAALSLVNESEITGSFVVEDLKPGINYVEVQLALPEGISLVSDKILLKVNYVPPDSEEDAQIGTDGENIEGEDSENNDNEEENIEDQDPSPSDADLPAANE